MKNPTLFRVNDKVFFHDQHNAGFAEECVVICKIRAIHYNKSMRRWEAWLQGHSSSESLEKLKFSKDVDHCTKWNIDDVLIFPGGESGVVEKIKIYFGHEIIRDRYGKVLYSIAGKFKLVDQENL
jgi:hypothetical protein